MILSPKWPTRSMWLALLRGVRSNGTFEHEGMKRLGLSQGLGRAEPATHINPLKTRCGEECTVQVVLIVHLLDFLTLAAQSPSPHLIGIAERDKGFPYVVPEIPVNALDRAEYPPLFGGQFQNEEPPTSVLSRERGSRPRSIHLDVRGSCRWEVQRAHSIMLYCRRDIW